MPSYRSLTKSRRTEPEINAANHDQHSNDRPSQTASSVSHCTLTTLPDAIGQKHKSFVVGYPAQPARRSTTTSTFLSQHAPSSPASPPRRPYKQHAGKTQANQPACPDHKRSSHNHRRLSSPTSRHVSSGSGRTRTKSRARRRSHSLAGRLAWGRFLVLFAAMVTLRRLHDHPLLPASRPSPRSLSFEAWTSRESLSRGIEVRPTIHQTRPAIFCCA